MIVLVKSAGSRVDLDCSATLRKDGLDRPEVVREVRPRVPEDPRRRLSSALQGHALHLRARRDSPR